MRRKASLLVLTLSLFGATLYGQVQGFDTYGWQQKDSVITTLFYGGALNVCDVLIEQAYEAEKGNEEVNKEAVAVFSGWQGVRYMARQSLDTAKIYLQEALSIYAEEVSLQDSAYRDVLLNMGDVLTAQGSFGDASANFRQALAVMDVENSSNKALYLNTLTNVISVELQNEDLDEAEEFAKKALGFAQKNYGEKTDEYISALTNLGKIYQSKGQSRRASNVILQAYELSKVNLPANHINKLMYANNAADIYEGQGRRAAVGEVHDEMLQFFEDNPAQQESAMYPIMLEKKAAWFDAGGLIDDAYELYNKANILLSLRAERTSREYIQSEMNMASILRRQKKYHEAEGYYQSALQYAPRLYGPSSRPMAILHDNLGDMYTEMEDFAQALTHQQAALSLYEMHMKDQDPTYAISLQKLGDTHLKLGLDSLSEDNFNQAQNILVDIYGDSHPAVFENSIKLVKQYWSRNTAKTSEFLSIAKSCAVQALSKKVSLMAAAERDLIYQDAKQLIDLFASHLLHQFNAAQADELSDLIGVYKTSRAQSNLVSIASLQTNPSIEFRKKYNEWQSLRKQILTTQNLALANQTETKEWEDEASSLQEMLIAGYKKYDLVLPNAKQVREGLKPNETFLDFIEVRLYDGSIHAFEDKPTYLAIVNGGKATHSQLVQLSLNQNATATSQARNQAAYYQQLWKPIEEKLTGITTIYVSPDGDLHQISFASLPTADGGFVFDKFEVHRILSVASLFSLRDVIPNKEALLFGDPDFSMAQDTSDVYQLSNRFSIPSNFLGSSTNHQKVSFSTITATENEVKSIQTLLGKKKWKVQTHLGQDASTTAFLEQISNCEGIVHLATKAYYIDPDSVSEPMLLSGIGLAGAKDGWSSEQSYGHISALELSSLDLQKIDLLVVGYHEVKSGEALYALQSALRFSGVKNMLFTLWDVPGEGRQTFFGLFYKYLAKNQSVKTALKNTKKKMRKKFDPIHWAGFVLLE